jgi:PAS domain S-box-containing protein
MPSNCDPEGIISGHLPVENQLNPFARCFSTHRDRRAARKTVQPYTKNLFVRERVIGIYLKIVMRPIYRTRGPKCDRDDLCGADFVIEYSGCVAMSWIAFVWSVNVGACLALAAIYMGVWCKQRETWMYLLFSCFAAAAGAIAVFELQLIHADTPEKYGAILRWRSVPTWMLVVSLVGFTRFYFRSGRSWLEWSVCGTRTLALILNFIFVPNLRYREITSLRKVVWWGGETVSVPVGVTNPWILVPQLSLLLLVIFFVDATISAWRRGDRQNALVVGGALIFFSAIASGQLALVASGIIQAPYLDCFAYLGLITAMGYQLSKDVLHRTHLARQLQTSQAALRQTEQHMQIAASAADLALFTWDLARDDVWLSQKARSVYGFPPAEKLDTERVRSVIHPDDRDLVRNAVKASLQTGLENPVEYRVVLPDGKTRWLSRRSRTEFDPNGTPIFMYGILFDITERKLAEERSRLVVEAAATAMIMVNQEGEITLINKRVEALFGYKREELIDQPVEMLVPERFRSHHADYRHSYFRDPKARSIGAGRELFGRRKDGSEVPLEIGLSPIHTSEGLSALASIVDISERKQAELERARQRHELAHLGRVATVGELSGSLAHELNQPLAAILSNAQAAQQFLDGDNADLNEVREILNDIISQDERAGEVIRRLRELLRKEGPQKDRDDVDLNEVVRDVLKLMRNDLINQKVTVNTDLAQNLPRIRADRVQLQQVLLNLVLNGCDAMTDSDSSERQLLIVSKLENGEVRLSVTDRGGGIPAEKIEKVFERFFTTKKKGMGVGLSICRSIIDAHEGKIWATNNADCGATFYFSLPIDRHERGQ